MRKKLAMLLLVAAILTVTACSGEEPAAGTGGGSGGETAGGTVEPNGAIEINGWLISIQAPTSYYAYSVEEDRVVLSCRGREYGTLSTYDYTVYPDLSEETDSIIRDLSGAGDVTELLDTRQEEAGTRYVFVVHRKRFAYGDIELLTQAGILSEEAALAQEQTEVHIVYHLDGDQWWELYVSGDGLEGGELAEATEFEIQFEKN